MLQMKVLDYRIASDENQVTVTKVRRKNGKVAKVADKNGVESESVKIIGYYSNLSRALVAIQRDYVLAGGKAIQTIKEYKEELEYITNTLEDSLNIKEEKFGR